MKSMRLIRYVLLMTACSAIVAVVQFHALAKPLRAQGEIYSVPCSITTWNLLTLAILDANEHAGHDTIVIEKGSQGNPCNVLLNLIPQYGQSVFPPITDDLTILGQGAILRRQSDSPYQFRMFQSDDGVHLTIHELTLRRGYAERGGAIWARGPLTLTGSIFLENGSGRDDGGAVFVSGPLVVNQSTFMTNTSRGVAAHGGAIFAQAVTVQGGSQFVNNSADQQGGAIYASGEVMISEESHFERNRAGYYGGAIYGATNVTIEDSFFIDNRSDQDREGDGGGAIFVGGDAVVTNARFFDNLSEERGGALFVTGKATLVGNIFQENSAYRGGGGLFARGGATVESTSFLSNTSTSGGGGLYAEGETTLVDSTFEHNRGSSGGGFEVHDAPTTIENSRIAYNDGGSGGGGGGYVQSAIIRGSYFGFNVTEFWGGGLASEASVDVIDSTFEGNIAHNDTLNWGGGLLASTGATIRNSRFINNRAGKGGGAYVAHALPSSSVIVNNLWIDNEANDGAALALGISISELSEGTSAFNHNTVVHTDTGSGSALQIEAVSATIRNNIIAGYAAGIGNAGTSVTSDYNLFFGNAVTHSGMDMGPQDQIADPLFVDAANGGYRVQGDSPAVNSGYNSGIGVDIDGTSRPQEGIFDRGAYEYVPVETPIDGLVASNNGPGEPGKAIQFSAEVAAGTGVTYTWDFGDGATATGASASHSYLQPGSYTAKVTARNRVGEETAETTVQVNAPQPTDQAIVGLSAASNSPTALGSATTLIAFVDAGTNVAYTWDFGDGSEGSGAAVNHTYAAPGVYTVVVTARNGVSEETAEVTVEVTGQDDPPPTGDQEISGLTATHDGPTRLGEATNFAAAVESGTNVTYAWDFGDGTTGIGENVSHTYAQPGVYTARVEAANGASQQEAVTEVVVEEETSGSGGSNGTSEQIYLPVAFR